MGIVTLQDWIRNTVFWNVFDHHKNIVVETKAFNFVPANASFPALLIQRIVWYCAYLRCYLPAPSVPFFPLLVMQATTLGTTLCFGQLASYWGGHEGDCAAGGRKRNFPSFVLFTLPGGGSRSQRPFTLLQYSVDVFSFSSCSRDLTAICLREQWLQGVPALWVRAPDPRGLSSKFQGPAVASGSQICGTTSNSGNLNLLPESRICSYLYLLS